MNRTPSLTLIISTFIMIIAGVMGFYLIIQAHSLMSREAAKVAVPMRGPLSAVAERRFRRVPRFTGDGGRCTNITGRSRYDAAITQPFALIVRSAIKKKGRLTHFSQPSTTFARPRLFTFLVLLCPFLDCPLQLLLAIFESHRPQRHAPSSRPPVFLVGSSRYPAIHHELYVSRDASRLSSLRHSSDAEAGAHYRRLKIQIF